MFPFQPEFFQDQSTCAIILGAILVLAFAGFTLALSFNTEIAFIGILILFSCCYLLFAIIMSQPPIISEITQNGDIILSDGSIKPMPPQLQDDFENMTYEEFRDRCEKLEITTYYKLEKIDNIKYKFAV